MRSLRNLFFETRMTWLRVVLFAVAAAAVTALMLILPFTKDTSFGNIGVAFECWIVFALVIIMNAGAPLEAGCKTFVFFLISQPLIYLLQVPFSWQGWHLFQYYPRWAVLTAACLPGGMIAYFVKKDTVLSALILSVAAGILGGEAVRYIRSAIASFPHNSLSAAFCIVWAVLLILVLLRKKKTRIVCAAATLVLSAAFSFLF